MDARSGLTPADIEVAEMLRRRQETGVFVVNKVDGDKLEMNRLNSIPSDWRAVHHFS